MAQYEVKGIKLESLQGDITAQRDLTAIVNAANAELLPGGGVAGAIHRAAGAGLVEECRPLAPIEPGQAVITSAHNLPNQYVIHCLGPVYGHDHPAADLLASCYRNALRLAEAKSIASIGFPALSTGIFGYPKDDAAKVCLDTIVAALSSLRSLKLIRFVLFDAESLAIYRAGLASMNEQD